MGGDCDTAAVVDFLHLAYLHKEDTPGLRDQVRPFISNLFPKPRAQLGLFSILSFWVERLAAIRSPRNCSRLDR